MKNRYCYSCQLFLLRWDQGNICGSVVSYMYRRLQLEMTTLSSDHCLTVKVSFGFFIMLNEGDFKNVE